MDNEASELYKQSLKVRGLGAGRSKKRSLLFVNEHFLSKRNDLKGNCEIRITNYAGNQLKIENQCCPVKVIIK